jgi:hypothetical protein
MSQDQLAVHPTLSDVPLYTIAQDGPIGCKIEYIAAGQYGADLAIVSSGSSDCTAFEISLSTSFVDLGNSPTFSGEDDKSKGSESFQTPINVGLVSKLELSLRKLVASERDEIHVSKKAKTVTSGASSSATTKSTKSTTSSSSIVKTFKQRLYNHAVPLIKHKAHNYQRKPWTEIEDLLPVEVAEKFMDGFPAKSQSEHYIKWELKDIEVARWLECGPYIHRVKFDGWTLGKRASSVYAWAGFDSCQVELERSTGILQVRIRTFVAGYGRPKAEETFPPSLK